MAHPASMLASRSLAAHAGPLVASTSGSSVSAAQSSSCDSFRIGPCPILNCRWSNDSFAICSRRIFDTRLRSGRPRETVDFTLAEEEEEEVSPNVVSAPPPSTGRIDIVVDKRAIRELDLSAAHAVLRKFVHQIGDNTAAPPTDPKELFDRTVGFVLKYERDDPLDPRELSEMPDIRLWFVRLDAAYPWLPVVLDWRAGELARYTAMLVPHQMSKKSGLVFNPEALELFVMNKVFVVHPWLRARGVNSPNTKLTNMLRMLGLSVSDQFYGLLGQHPPPA
ncbi:hypothetical protein Mapa_010680 [Marchantia paleacea]|nr:hypothetical protein Mapa_010680 [Marchantia paleacea]